MAHTFAKSKFLMYYPETTVCAPPNDWATDGKRIEFISVDCQPKQELIVDPTAEGNPLAVGKRTRRKGIRNVTWSMVLKVHGTGSETAGGNQVVHTYLSTVLAWCLGGSHRSNSTTITGGSAIAPQISDATNFIPGMMAGFIDNDEDKVHFRRVLNVSGTTLTLSEELPFTPVEGDIVPATITVYVDRAVLKDAVAGPSTFNWLYRNEESGTDLLWQLEGTVGTLALQNLGRGQLPQVSISCMSANFSHTSADGLSAVVMPPAVGTSAQLAMGTNVLCSIGVYGNTDIAAVETNAVSFETGIARTKVETSTEKTNRFEGLSTYSFSSSDTKFNATLVPFDAAWYDGLKDDDEYRINYYQPGPGDGAGKAWCLHVARAQIVATPTRADVGEVNGVALEFTAMIPGDCTNGSNEHLKQSPFLIAIA